MSPSLRDRLREHFGDRCAYCDTAAHWRATWTVFGGALVYKKLCNYHASFARGQRGIQLEALNRD